MAPLHETSPVPDTTPAAQSVLSIGRMGILDHSGQSREGDGEGTVEK